MIRIALILIICSFGLIRGETIRNWESLTSFGQVQDVIRYQDEIWAATLGGLVRVDPEDLSFTTYTNVDGLGTNELYILHEDGIGRLWVGGRGRLVNFTDPADPDVYLISDNDDRDVEIYDIASTPSGDTLWLANRLGVALFLPGDGAGEGLIQDNFDRLGDIEGETAAKSIVLDEDSVWVGTERGLAVGSREDIRRLKAPANWTSYEPVLLHGDINDNLVEALLYRNDSLYVGTSQGAYYFETDPVVSLTSLGIYGNPYVYDLDANDSLVIISTERGAHLYSNGFVIGLTWEGLPSGVQHSISGAYDDNGVYWNGNLSDGLYRLNGDVFEKLEIGGAPNGECRDIAETMGKIWGAFYRQGLAYYENNAWHKVSDTLVSGLLVSLAVGPLGELWVGTWGNGVYRIDGDTVMHFNAENSILSGVDESPLYVVVSDIYCTASAVWMANLRGINGEIVCVNPYNLDQWQNYVLVGGAGAEWLECIIEGQGIVYAGSLNNGIYGIAYYSTPFNTNGDYRFQFTHSNSGIGSNLIRRMAVDTFDSLWVGTSYGLSYQGLGEIIFTNVTLPDGFGPEITALAFDARGNLYAGSKQGIVARDLASGDMEQMTTRNSSLMDDAVNAIYFQESAGAFWIATASGVARMTVPYAEAAQDIEQVLAYPNPFVIRYGDETVRFNFAGNAVIRVFTLAGELVREIPYNGSWDGRNSAGKQVASGVYLFTLTGDDGQTGRGKILLIRD